jgi:hypothetical protein
MSFRMDVKVERVLKPKPKTGDDEEEFSDIPF